MVLHLRNEGKTWYKVPCCCFLVDGCCCFLMGSGWSLLFPNGLGMVAVISWWVLHDHCYCRMDCTCLLLFPDGLTPRLISMVRIHTARSRRKVHYTGSPCLVHTFWHMASLKLKEIFGTREGFQICPHQLSPLLNNSTPGTFRGREWGSRLSANGCQDQGLLDPQVIHIGGAQRFQAFCLLGRKVGVAWHCGVWAGPLSPVWRRGQTRRGLGSPPPATLRNPAATTYNHGPGATGALLCVLWVGRVVTFQGKCRHWLGSGAPPSTWIAAVSRTFMESSILHKCGPMRCRKSRTCIQ